VDQYPRLAVGEAKEEGGPEVVVVGEQRRADNIRFISSPPSPRTVFYDPMADILRLIDHHIQH